jgi:N-hydroxyarylamine O-acetyltransferase
MNIQAYLKRINYSGSLEPTADTLRALQVAHLKTVPFENLSIHANEPIVLEDNALFDKIVRRRRGGYCYEANGLFAALLRALGFEVAMLAAGVAEKEGGFGPQFDDDHLILMRRNDGSDWEPQYRFTLQPYTFADYEETSMWHQTSPDSHFTKNRICSLATDDGRVTLSDMRLITTGHQQLRYEQTLTTQEEYDRILRDQFGIVMKLK